jgi:hypothetical protein
MLTEITSQIFLVHVKMVIMMMELKFANSVPIFVLVAKIQLIIASLVKIVLFQTELMIFQ